jgi:predicted O-linked N-acetylglucosamine transferase (SPINDLY family)
MPRPPQIPVRKSQAIGKAASPQPQAKLAALFMQGLSLHQQGQLAQAEQIYAQVLALQPVHFDALHLSGVIALQSKNPALAVELIGKAIEIKPDYAAAYYNRGLALQELKRLEEALSSYDRAIEIKPDFEEAYLNRGNALRKLKLLDEALASYEMVFILNPNYPFIKGEIIHTMMLVNKWDSHDALIDSINQDVTENKLSASPFGYQGVCNAPVLLYKAAKIFSYSKFPPQKYLINKTKRVINEKIKIAYLCGEFRNQATSILMINLWENHDKNKFEIIGLDNGYDDKSKIRERIEKAFDKLIDISKMNDLKIVEFIYEENIDILVNLNCFFGLARNIVFSYKPAPVQVNYLGFPGTLGANYLDYIISDKTVIPKKYQEFYSEKIVYLPNSYQVNDRQRVISDKVFTKEELGLPNDGFIFCCFNNNYKITPNTFGGWVRILKAVEGSVLWLLEDNPTARLNLRKEAENRGLNPNRLVFAKRMKLPEHLARHRVTDLFLDTLPYNAHTTASDALWAGIPVLTCVGESFASRVAASLLNAIELPDLITTTQAEYEAKAIELANNPAKLKAIKDKLERNRLTTALFDTPRFTKHIEAAFTQIYERYQSDLPPDHIYIDAQ